MSGKSIPCGNTECGNYFVPSVPTQKYCCPACRYAANNDKRLHGLPLEVTRRVTKRDGSQSLTLSVPEADIDKLKARPGSIVRVISN